ncbi:hypothetical protein D3C81_2190750 [compost metagenome]
MVIRVSSVSSSSSSFTFLFHSAWVMLSVLMPNQPISPLANHLLSLTMAYMTIALSRARWMNSSRGVRYSSAPRHRSSACFTAFIAPWA